MIVSETVCSVEPMKRKVSWGSGNRIICLRVFRYPQVTQPKALYKTSPLTMVKNAKTLGARNNAHLSFDFCITILLLKQVPIIHNNSNFSYIEILILTFNFNSE